MGRHMMVAVQVMARYSRSMSMAQVSPIFIISVAHTVTMVRLQITTERIHRLDWYCWVTRCMGLPAAAVFRAMVQFLPSIPMVQLLRTCIVSRDGLHLLRPPT